MNRKLGVIALAAFLLLYGLLLISNVKFEAQSLLMGLLAIVAAVLLLLDK